MTDPRHPSEACPISTSDRVPVHFLPTSTGPRWRGKLRCAYCNHTGWRLPDGAYAPNWWSHNHGEFCANAPAASEVA